MIRTRVYRVPKSLEGMRADRVLAELVPSLSKTAAGRLCERGSVRVDGRPLHKGTLVRPGAVVVVDATPSRCAAPDPDTELQIRYQSDSLVIVNKIAGVPSAPRNGTELGTIANALLARFPEMACVGYGPLEPGLLHRLDTGTSGLLIAARTAGAFLDLRDALQSNAWTKEYLALVREGTLAEVGCFTAPIATTSRRAARVTVVEAGCSRQRPTRSARSAETRYRVLERRGNVALLTIRAPRAVRHQIRAHFAAAGSPLVNDVLYGAAPEKGLEKGRFALHAARVAWPGSPTVEAFDVSEPLADDLTRWFDNLV